MQDSNAFIEDLKKITLYLFRINKWNFAIYENFIDLSTELVQQQAPRCSFFNDNLDYDSDRIHIVLSNALSILKNANIDFKAPLDFKDDDERVRFDIIPNDFESLWTGLYFFFLPEENQERLYQYLIRRMIQKFNAVTKT